MEEVKTIALVVIIAIVVGAAIFTSLDVFIALSERKNALGRKPGYFNIVYRPESDTKFYRAHLVGVDCPESRAMRKAVTEERKIL